MHEDIYEEARYVSDGLVDVTLAMDRVSAVWERHLNNALERLENLELQAEEHAGRASRLERQLHDARASFDAEERARALDAYENEHRIKELERQLADAQQLADDYRRRAARSY